MKRTPKEEEQKKRKNEADKLYNVLNSYYQNIKLTLYLNQSKFPELFEVTPKLQLECITKLKSL